MAVKIGHASKDETNHIKGGMAGDQTGTEVCIRSWYRKPWQFILRCKDSGKAEAMAHACECGCANPNIGYDQNQRNSLNKQAKNTNYDLSQIAVPCECDCSSFMTVCAQAAGIPIPYNGTNAPATSTMKTAFMSTNEFELLTDDKYLSNDSYLKRGDILVKPGSHTAMALTDGANAHSPSPASTPAAAPAAADSSYTTFVKGVQSACGAKVDGIAGKETLSKTVSVSKTKNRKHAVVTILQTYLNFLGYSCGTADGIAGPKFDSAVTSYQAANGCIPDGEITARQATWKKLLQLL